MKYFAENKLFSSKQFGFITGRSTVLQLLTLVDDWAKCLETGSQIDIVYTDFEKAFDKVPHQRLLSKLTSYGIHNSIVKWIESFLCFRKLQVRVNGKLSDWMDVHSGIPQGSVLGPLLFVIYINDLPEMCDKEGNLFLFADDAKVYKYVQDNYDTTILQKCCQELYNWSEKWLMKLNIDKCKIMTVTRSKKIIEYKYGFATNGGFVELERVDNMKDLGVIFDSDLSFKNHIYEKINKAYQMIGIINRNFRDLHKETFLLLYKSIVRSHIEYANSVWNPYKKSLIEDIEKVQKRATKMVKGLNKMSYIQRLKNLGLPTLKLRRSRGDMIEVYKIVTNKYDSEVNLSIPLMENSRTRGNSLKLRVDRAKLDLRKYSFTARVVSLWNSLPDQVVTAESVNSFKNRLDSLWKKDDAYYNYEVNVNASGIHML
jgi:hypothetical protein